jgi:hypothetical protein
MFKRIALVALFLGLFAPADAMLRGSLTTGSTIPTVSFAFATLTPTGTACGTGNNSCIIYVDNTAGQGNDSTCAPQSPPVTNTPAAGTQCATIAHAVTLLRNGKPDWLLLKNGDTFNPNDTFGSISVSGLSKTQLMVLATYGTSTTQPTVLVNASTPCLTQHDVGQADFIFLYGIRFYAFTRDPNNASFSLTDATTNSECLQWRSVSTASFNFVDIENIHASFFDLAIDADTNGGAEPGATCTTCTMVLNGNVITNDYPDNFNDHSQAAFLSGIGNLTLTWNAWDSNGFNQQLVGPYTSSMTCASPIVVTISGASPFPFSNGATISFGGTPCTGIAANTLFCAINVSGVTFNITASNPNGDDNPCPNGTTVLDGTGTSSGLTTFAADFEAQIFNRNIYTNASPTVYQFNISTNSSAEGIQFRSGGGPFDDNLFFNDSQCWTIGDGITGTVTGSSTRNVCMFSRDIFQSTGNLPRGDGTQVQDGVTGIIYTGNIIAHSSDSASANGAVSFDSTTSNASATGNVLCWPTIFQDSGTDDITSPNVTSTNTACTGLGLTDPTRTPATYSSTVLGNTGTQAQLLAALTACYVANTAANFNNACTAASINAWIRPGYNLAP